MNDAAASYMQDLLDNPVELDERLVPWLYDDSRLGPVLKHPLVFSVPHAPFLNARLNAQLEAKLTASAEARAARNWSSWIMFHERPYRLNALLDIEDEMTDTEWWTEVADVWTDSENIRENPDEWDEILRSDRGHREALMSDDDRAAFDALPDEVTVYQGHTDERDDGWSWTTDRAKAVWFGRRFAMFEDSTPMLTTMTVPKSSIVAMLVGRGESEALIDPDNHTDPITEELGVDGIHVAACRGCPSGAR